DVKRRVLRGAARRAARARPAGAAAGAAGAGVRPHLNARPSAMTRRPVALVAALLLAAGAATDGERDRAAAERALGDIAAAQAALEAMRLGLPPHAVPPRPLTPSVRAGGDDGAVRSPRGTGDLSGLTGDQLRATMGEPDLVRDEGEVQAWLYRGPSCMLDVFLEGEPSPKVVLATARGGALERVPEEVCLRTLSRGRAGRR
ncbi:MAG: hypothetical protein SNJ73_04330, partial [Acetobacteraceae bacterium]